MVSMAARAPVSPAVAALRRGRQALIELDGQLNEVLVWVRDPRAKPDRTAPDRLAQTARRAGQALTSLTPSHAIF
jgi:hypothetical protein